MTWSIPGNVSKLVPAVPSVDGVADVFAFQSDGTVQAITSDGTVAWTGDATNALGAVSRIMPDFQGGLVLAPWDPATGKRKYYRLDGMTGQRLDFNLGTDHAYAVGLFPDGTFSAVINTTQEVVGLDLTTGAEKFRDKPAAGAGYGDMIVAGDGMLIV